MKLDSSLLSDSFLDLPTSAKCLYLMLEKVADVNGCIKAPTAIIRLLQSTESDMHILLDKGLLTFSEKEGLII